MKLGGVHHVSINVHDADLVGRFYTDVLGLETLPRPDFPFKGLWLRAGGQQIHLIEVAGHVAPEGQHFAFEVDDIESICAALAARGVTVSPPRTLPGAGRQAFFRDPSGNLIELNQPGPGA
ncbi:MAG: lactoylglutathione lyase [Deltaproteobacteria bacterium]|nr:lactoylglutathione lyase [Deltaproteobacteria bacterium]